MSARRTLDLRIEPALERDAAALAGLRAEVAEALTRRHGKGHWSHPGTEAGVLRDIRTSSTLVARRDGQLLGMLRLATRKPWAITVEYFTPVSRPLYLLDMAVSSAAQGSGIGSSLLLEAVRVAKAWPSDAIRLDAYDGPVGAGGFYAKHGFQERGRVVYRGTPLVYFERLLG